ncbi:MAG: hypothetical protein Q4D58_00695 [Synergistaceae bacterium]|nr:hypothetical protein [Synergistaceae bacterium]
MNLTELLARFAAGAVSSLKLWAVQLVMDAERGIPGASGEDKRRYVVARLDDMVRLPWYLEPFDGPLFGLLADMVCDKLNLVLGHDWSGTEFSADQLEKVAAVADMPAEEARAAVKEDMCLDERIEAMYRRYGIK